MDSETLMTFMGYHTEESERFLKSAKEYYDEVEFNTEGLFNEPAPDPLVAFTIGGVLSVLGFGLWLWRIKKLHNTVTEKGHPWSANTLMRAMISSAIDSDSPIYVIVSYGAASFLFLGGIQLDYEWTLLAMVVFYFVVSAIESLRVFLALSNAKSLADVVLTSSLMQSQLREVSTELKPANVYEDLGRAKTVVVMVFLTQVVLISFVCYDMSQSPTSNCFDGSRACPVGGTFGSWTLYVLGIFMACVFQLGPNTSFGQSEQNPAYWLQLFLATKGTRAQIRWFDPVANKTKESDLSPSDWKIWVRFLMSFLINGVGYHILVHALPIQVAAQSSLVGVVFRAVGMMYLVNLDDTTGYTLTVIEKASEEPFVKADPDEPPSDSEQSELTGNSTKPNDHAVGKTDLTEFSVEANKIIEDARAKLEALAQGKSPSQNVPASHLIGGALLIASPNVDSGVSVDMSA